MTTLQAADRPTSDHHALTHQVSINDIQAVHRVTRPAIEYEPIRDWSFGLLSGHRLRVICYTAVGIAALYALQGMFWPRGSAPHTLLEDVWSWGSVLWISQVVTCGLGLTGVIAYEFPRKLDHVAPISQLVSLRIVSRGTNVEALTKTIRRCQREMAKTPLFPYLIEVVTDVHDDSLPAANGQLHYITVPTSYVTANQSLYKARALQYAVEHSPLPDKAWIVHLDEETHITRSGIKGIAAMIREEAASGSPRIGQGAILYHRNWRKHPFLTLADNLRTGDDFARFHFQHRLGITIFGLHGSYIVVRNDVEKSIGFDFGPKGSITEDAFWALVAMQRGYRCRWVEGYLEEQSTQSLADFVRQRRRWFQGLTKVALHAPVRLRWRLCLGINTILWALAPFAMLYTVVHFFYGFALSPWIHFFANFTFASFGTLYLLGLLANLDEHGVRKRHQRLGWSIAQVVLLPTFSVLESLGVLAAIFKPVSGFHVVKK